MQNQKAQTAYFLSKELLHFDFSEQLVKYPRSHRHEGWGSMSQQT